MGGPNTSKSKVFGSLGLMTLETTPLRNKGLIAGLIKGHQWLISPDHKAGYFWWGVVLMGVGGPRFSASPGKKCHKQRHFLHLCGCSVGSQLCDRCRVGVVGWLMGEKLEKKSKNEHDLRVCVFLCQYVNMYLYIFTYVYFIYTHCKYVQ